MVTIWQKKYFSTWGVNKNHSEQELEPKHHLTTPALLGCLCLLFDSYLVAICILYCISPKIHCSMVDGKVNLPWLIPITLYFFLLFVTSHIYLLVPHVLLSLIECYFLYINFTVIITFINTCNILLFYRTSSMLSGFL